MANSLLDFVMALVRDPDAAARYAADPHQALADAHLTGVTSADVQNLMPVVSESLSMSLPAHGLGDHLVDPGVVPVDNVWASGAATAAFDAFGDHATVDHHTDPLAGHVPVVVSDITAPAVSDGLDDIDDLHEAVSSAGFDVPMADAADAVVDAHTVDGLLEDWAGQIPEHHLPTDHSAPDVHGFDL